SPLPFLPDGGHSFASLGIIGIGASPPEFHQRLMTDKLVSIVAPALPAYRDGILELMRLPMKRSACAFLLLALVTWPGRLPAAEAPQEIVPQAGLVIDPVSRFARGSLSVDPI